MPHAFVTFNITHLSFSSVDTYRATSLINATQYSSVQSDHLIRSVHAQTKVISISHSNNEAMDICWYVFPLEYNLLVFVVVVVVLL